MKGRHKPAHKKVVRTTISLHPVLAGVAEGLIQQAAFGGLSEFVADCIRIRAGLNVGAENLELKKTQDDARIAA